MTIKIGITGHSGLIGKHFIKKYKQYKYFKFKGDIKNKNHINAWIKEKNFNYLLHLAAKVPTQYVNSNYKESYNVNVNGTKNLLRSSIESKKIKWFFFASTSHVYGSCKGKLSENSRLRPFSKYGYTKLVAEKFLISKKKKINFKICISRIFSITHPKQHISYAVPSILRKIRKSNKIINLENLNHTRDFCHVDDICRGINILLKKKSNGIYNLGSSIPVNLKYIALYFAKKKSIIFKDNKKETRIVANNNKIRRLGFNTKYGIKKILKDF